MNTGSERAEPSPRTVSAAVETSAGVTDVLALLADAARLPEWAPGFADRVEGDASAGWRVIKGDQRFDLQVVLDAEAGTVDYLRELAAGRRGGSYLRAVPAPGSGAVVTMTIPVRPSATPQQAASELDEELTRLAALL